MSTNKRSYHFGSALGTTTAALLAAALVGLLAACGQSDGRLSDAGLSESGSSEGDALGTDSLGTDSFGSEQVDVGQSPADQASQAAESDQPLADVGTGADSVSPLEAPMTEGGAPDSGALESGASDAGVLDAGAPSVTSEGGIDGQFTELNWDELYELDLETGEPSPLLTGLDGQPVKIPGFMVPLDDSASTVREFLLVPFAGACIHVPAPPPNQIVHVTMVDGESSEVYWWDPIWIYGNLEIENVEHAYGQASYRLGGLRTEVYTAQEPTP